MPRHFGKQLLVVAVRIPVLTMRALLAHAQFWIVGSQHVSDLIPMIGDKEVAEVKAFLMDRNHKHISIVFGGTTHVCEAMAIIARCIGADFTIYQRLISLKLAAETMTGEQIAHRLLLTLAVTFQIDSPHLVTIMHDRASVNDVAMRTIKPLYPQVMDVG
eukprot:scpid97595/ scgid31347/ 